jgi:DNA polymerase III delta prime subunit
MSDTDLFENFIFTDRLTKQLKGLVERPDILRITPILCFHGYPGVGKTSFGKLLMSHLCSDHYYFPMNERSLRDKFIEEKIKPIYRTVSLFGDDGKVFPRGIFLDEFHNLTPKDQEKFKVVFDDLISKEDTFVILCVNTTGRKTISKCVTQPIYSRFHPINFNVRKEENEIDEIVMKVNNQYPLLSKNLVRSWVPDMRRITREGLMSELMKQEVNV